MMDLPATIKGSLNLTVVEGRDLPISKFSRSLNPYVKIAISDEKQKFVYKTPKQKRNVNPKWSEWYHFWISSLPVDVTLDVHDYEKAKSDKIVATSKFQITDMKDFDFDAVVDCRSKNKLKGKLLIKYFVRFKVNFDFDPISMFSEYTHIVIEPVQYLNIVEIKGPIKDMQLLHVMADIKSSLPQKMYSKSAARTGWEIKVAPPDRPWVMSHSIYKWKWEQTLNVAIRLVNNLALFGFILRRCDQIHKETIQQVYEIFDKSFLLIKPANPRRRMESHSPFRYFLAESSCTSDKFWEIDVFGEVERDLAESMKDPKKNLNFTNTQDYWIGRPEHNRNEDAIQQEFLKFINLSRSHNYLHSTVWGHGQIFQKQYQLDDKEKRSTGQYIFVFPFEVFGKWEIDLRGECINKEFLNKLWQSLPIDYQTKHTKPRKHKDAKFIEWYIPVPLNHKEEHQHSTEVKSKAEPFQSFLVMLLSTLEKLGFEIRAPHGHDGVILQQVRSPSMHTSPMDDVPRVILVDPCFNLQEILQIEIQGGLNDDFLEKTAFECGFPESHKSSYSYVFQNKTKYEDTYMRFLVLKIINWLSITTMFEPISQYYENAILLRRSPRAKPLIGQYMMLTVIIAKLSTVSFEIVGEIHEDHATALAKELVVIATEPVYNSRERIGWRFKTQVKTIPYQRLIGSIVPEERAFCNEWQPLFLKLISNLERLGWKYRFPYTKSEAFGFVYFKEE